MKALRGLELTSWLAVEAVSIFVHLLEKMSTENLTAPQSEAAESPNRFTYIFTCFGRMRNRARRVCFARSYLLFPQTPPPPLTVQICFVHF